MSRLAYAASAVAFAIGGALCRSALRTTQTRRQIAVATIVAGAFELSRKPLGCGDPGLMGFAANAAAAASAMTATKIRLEGVPDVGAWVRNAVGGLDDRPARCDVGEDVGRVQPQKEQATG